MRTGFERPVIIHRAILGSLERMIAIVTEQFVGKWPFWISPKQACVIPVSEKHFEFAKKIKNRLVHEGFSAEIDENNATLSKNIKMLRLIDSIILQWLVIKKSKVRQ